MKYFFLLLSAFFWVFLGFKSYHLGDIFMLYLFLSSGISLVLSLVMSERSK